MTDQTQPSPAPTQVQPPQARTVKKVLIVEDEKPMAKALEVKLNKSGFAAKAVFNGQQALEVLTAEKYDLALLDLMMPEMDGFDVLSKIREKQLGIKVIVTSNLSQEEDIKKAKALGAVDFLVKSNVSLADIVAKVTTLLQ